MSRNIAPCSRRNSRRPIAAAVAALLLLAAVPAATSRASVSLILTDNDATPGAATVLPGASFTVTVNLVSTAEKVTGLDYFLQSNAAGSGLFTLADRNTSASQFTDLLRENVGTTDSPGVLDAPGATLAAANAYDLGGVLANVNAPLTAGTYTVATYTIAVSPTAAPGTYTLSTMSLPATGFTGPGPDFADNTLSAQGSFTVTVANSVNGNPVPEPTGAAALFGLGLVMLAGRRRA